MDYVNEILESYARSMTITDKKLEKELGVAM
jgi:hypothetical protein